MAGVEQKKLLSDNAHLMSEWNWEKNYQNGISPDKLSLGSGRKVWWKCADGHEWEAVISARNRGNGCPYCSGRIPIIGVNDLQTVYPEIAKEWDYEKNDAHPNQVTSRSHKKAWWLCSNGHSYQCTVHHRSYGDSCPYCSNHKVLPGFNDLVTQNPELAKQWNYNKNEGLTPSDVTVSSGKKVWWVCSNGHEWQSAIYSRNKGVGCPVCSNKSVLQGVNDLMTLNPALTNEWNYNKNGVLLPSMVTPHSGKKVWWVCSKGHEWQASVDHRSNGRGCPICLTDRRSSFPEQAIFYYLSKKYLGSKNRYKFSNSITCRQIFCTQRKTKL